MSRTRRLSSEETRTRRSELGSYLWGLVLALMLTVLAFALVWLERLGRQETLFVIGALALVQVAVHCRFFLHLDLSRQKREDLLLILFSGLLLLIMIGGTIWIMWSLYARMASDMMPGAMPPETF